VVGEANSGRVEQAQRDRSLTLTPLELPARPSLWLDRVLLRVAPLSMRRWSWAVLAIACVSSQSIAQGTTLCGRERWPVKVAVDRDAGEIDTTIVPTTIARLTQIPRPTPPFAYNRRIGPYERTTYRVVAFLREVISESDSDLHLVLADTGGPMVTLVAEIPDSVCAIGSVYLAAYANARRSLSTAAIGSLLEVDGIGFFDYHHGQRGMAPNAFELHPVVGLRVIAGSIALDSTRDRRVKQASSDRGEAVANGNLKVWVNTGSMVYHCAGTRWYGATKRGYYSSQQEAKAAGARPAYGRTCS
jgi:hypothetical protein